MADNDTEMIVGRQVVNIHFPERLRDVPPLTDDERAAVLKSAERLGFIATDDSGATLHG